MAHVEPTSLRHSLPSEPTAASDYFCGSPLPPAALLGKISLETKLLGIESWTLYHSPLGSPENRRSAENLRVASVDIFSPKWILEMMGGSSGEFGN